MNSVLKNSGMVLAAVWIFGGALFFYLRFTIVVFTDKQDAIEGLLSSLFGK